MASNDSQRGLNAVRASQDSFYYVIITVRALVLAGLVERQGRGSYRVLPGQAPNLNSEYLWRVLR